MDAYIWLPPILGIVALIFALGAAAWVARQDPGTEQMQAIAADIRAGAMAFLLREYRLLSIFVVVVAGLLAWANAKRADSDTLIAFSFIIGAVCSGLAGLLGMRAATAANVRTTQAARLGLVPALRIALNGGAVMGMSVVGLALLGLGGLLLIFTQTELLGAIDLRDRGDLDRVLNVIAGFSLGASSIALFARVGGGIFTKAADVGADLVGKVEAGIPEDDPRNPATIADNVGDNVGDVAGMGADLFESYVGAIVCSMILGVGWTSGVPTELALAPILLPLLIAGAGTVVSMLATVFIRLRERDHPQRSLGLGVLAAGASMILIIYGLVALTLGDHDFAVGDARYSGLGVFFAAASGLIAGIAIGIITGHYTSDQKQAVKRIADESTTGSATNIISGLGTGMLSTVYPTLVICAAILIAHHSAGLYGIAMAALGMLSTTGLQLALDAYGPIADNAGGIAEMARLDPEIRARTDQLDAVGNTTAAIGKGFAVGSAALTALALFSAFASRAEIDTINVMDPKVMVGVLIGAMLPFMFSALALKAVSRAAFKMIEEVRRQFREIPGLRAGQAKAEPAKCVDISTNTSIKEMMTPGVLAVSAPILAGLYDLHTLGGLLVGTTVCGVMMAMFMSNAGGAWDNAKKFIEGGQHGGKGSPAHKAAVIGDTVGDPFKDTAGPALNILIKLMSVIALVLAPALSEFHGQRAEPPAPEISAPEATTP